MSKNVDKLTDFIANLKVQPSMIALMETKLIENTVSDNIDLNGHKLVSCDSTTLAGGVGLYILESLPLNINTNIKINLNFVKNMWIEIIISNAPFIIGVIYRHP